MLTRILYQGGKIILHQLLAATTHREAPLSRTLCGGFTITEMFIAFYFYIAKMYLQIYKRLSRSQMERIDGFRVLPYNGNMRKGG